jgi:MFS transporter, DHA2 family, glioxin efflux transporter
VGYFQPFLTLGGLLTTIAAGLICTLDIDTSYAKDLGYQAFFGIGNGICTQVPLIACQAFSDPADIPVVTAIVLCELPYLSPLQ